MATVNEYLMKKIILAGATVLAFSLLLRLQLK